MLYIMAELNFSGAKLNACLVYRGKWPNLDASL